MECHYCHKPNHFLSVCRKRIKISRRRQRLREISGHYSDIKSRWSDIKVSFGLKTQINYVSRKFRKLNLKVNGISINAPNDTDSTLNIIPESVIQKMRPRHRLQTSRTKVNAFWQKKLLPIRGKFTCTVTVKKRFATATVYVIAGNTDTILSYENAVELRILPVICCVSKNKYEELCHKNSDYFKVSENWKINK